MDNDGLESQKRRIFRLVDSLCTSIDKELDKVKMKELKLLCKEKDDNIRKWIFNQTVDIWQNTPVISLLITGSTYIIIRRKYQRTTYQVQNVTKENVIKK